MARFSLSLIAAMFFGSTPAALAQSCGDTHNTEILVEGFPTDWCLALFTPDGDLLQAPFMQQGPNPYMISSVAGDCDLRIDTNKGSGGLSQLGFLSPDPVIFVFYESDYPGF